MVSRTEDPRVGQMFQQSCKEEQAKLDALPSFSSQWLQLLSKLKDLECNKEDNGVCCRTQYKIVNGNIVKQVEEFPFMARIHIKTGFGTSAFCGATLKHLNLAIEEPKPGDIAVTAVSL